MINISKIIVLFSVFFACSLCVGQTKSTERSVADTVSMYNKLDNYLHSLSKNLTVKNYDAIIFMSDGTCSSCMKSFSDFVCQQLLNEQRILIILNAKGQQFNTSPYLSDTVKNVVTDYSNDFIRLKIASERTVVIILKENNIDGIYPVNPATLSDQITLLARMKHRQKGYSK